MSNSIIQGTRVTIVVTKWIEKCTKISFEINEVGEKGWFQKSKKKSIYSDCPQPVKHMYAGMLNWPDKLKYCETYLRFLIK